MLGLVLCVVFIILKVEADQTTTDNPVVRLCYSNNEDKDYTVWKDKSLNIIIENGYPLHVWCRSSYANDNLYNPDFIPTTAFNNDIIAKLYVENVTAEMSTRWACTVLKNYQAPGTPYEYMSKNYTATTLYFNLHVRGARAVILSANSRNLTYTITTNLPINYEGDASYAYVDGEDLEISCKKAHDFDRNSTLRLEYYNASGILLFKTKSREKNPHLFRIVLKSDNDNDYLDCICATENPLREYRYRTRFLKKKGDLQAGSMERVIILYVNGQELTTVFHKDPSYDDYVFRYTDKVILNVTCRNTLKLPPYFLYNKYYVKQKSTHRSYSARVVSVEIPTSKITNETLTCGINNSDIPKTFARILFLHDDQGHDVRIKGLPRNNILYQYTNDENQQTIEYQYYVNEALNLTFELNTRFQVQRLASDLFQWKFEGKSYESPADKSPSYPSIKWSQKTFTKVLGATHNGTKLRCAYFPYGKGQSYVNRSVELIFRLKPELVDEEDKGESTSADDPKAQIISIAVSVGAAIGIITIICLVLWRKRIKRTHLIESPYDNLSNRNDSPIPAFPSQWENNCDDSHYSKIDEEVMEENDTYTTDTDKLYRMPNKRQSNTSENHYTEIDDCVKLKPSGLAVNCYRANPSNFNKEKDTNKGTQSHKANNKSLNNFCDSKQDTYDKLIHDNLPINKGNEIYNNGQKAGKSKTVTFRQMSNDLKTGLDYSEGTSRQHSENNYRRIKENSEGHYANVSQDINTQPGNLKKNPNYENHFLKNERFENNDYAEPYGDLGVSCKTDFYR